MPEIPSTSSDQVEIYREKQKTIRKGITYGVILVVGVLVIFLGGKFKLSKDGIEISKDILKETSQASNSSKEGSFTSGYLNADAKKLIEEKKNEINPSGFTGQNYINNDFGYLFSVKNPGKWHISYNPNAANSQDGTGMNTIDAGDGIVFKVSAGQKTEGENIETVATTFYYLLSAAAEVDPSYKPEISYDNASQTAFFGTKNMQNGKKILMKAIIKGNNYYFGYLEYPEPLANDPRVAELKEMVSTLTAI